MKKIVVDTNVVFSAILNTESNIGDLIMNSDEVFRFYSVQFLRQEIDNHKDKLIQISKLSEEEIIDCSEHPDACKQALETAADQAGNSRSSENIKDGCGTLDDWRANPGDWPKFPPIFFPDDKGPGIPMPPRMIGAHTDRIIRQIR